MDSRFLFNTEKNQLYLCTGSFLSSLDVALVISFHEGVTIVTIFLASLLINYGYFMLGEPLATKHFI